MKLSTYWAERSKIAFGDNNKHKALFGIIQGGLFDELRESLDDLLNIGFDGYAVGGLAVGETQDQMFKVLDGITKHMPENKPRYLMGVGTPSDILGAVKQRGIDVDCVMQQDLEEPGLAFFLGRINIRNSKYQKDNTPLIKILTNLI